LAQFPDLFADVGFDRCWELIGEMDDSQHMMPYFRKAMNVP
jgi:hypothetical protein